MKQFNQRGRRCGGVRSDLFQDRGGYLAEVWSLEHFDERLEDFFLSLEPGEFLYVDSNVSPDGIKSLATGIDQNKVLRHFDPESWRLIFRGEFYELEPLYKEIVDLCQKAESVERKL